MQQHRGRFEERHDLFRLHLGLQGQERLANLCRLDHGPGPAARRAQCGNRRPLYSGICVVSTLRRAARCPRRRDEPGMAPQARPPVPEKSDCAVRIGFRGQAFLSPLRQRLMPCRSARRIWRLNARNLPSTVSQEVRKSACPGSAAPLFQTNFRKNRYTAIARQLPLERTVFESLRAIQPYQTD